MSGVQRFPGGEYDAIHSRRACPAIIDVCRREIGGGLIDLNMSLGIDLRGSSHGDGKKSSGPLQTTSRTSPRDGAATAQRVLGLLIVVGRATHDPDSRIQRGSRYRHANADLAVVNHHLYSPVGALVQFGI